MSTVERRSGRRHPPAAGGRPALDQPTFHERYEAMPPGTWAELVGGVVYMPSPLRSEHGDYDDVVACWTGHYKRVHQGLRGGRNATVILDDERRVPARRHLRIPAGAGRPDPDRRRVTSSARPSWWSRSPAPAAITT